MLLTRFEYENNEGNLIGIAYDIPFGEESDDELEDEILLHENSFPIPKPYREHSISFFTEEGLKKYAYLISLWEKRCELNGYRVYICTREKETTKVLYEDIYQVLIQK